jgi:hypothetical protein
MNRVVCTSRQLTMANVGKDKAKAISKIVDKVQGQGKN